MAEDLLAPWSLEDADKGQKPVYVLDCIDNIQSKVELLHYCHKHSIPVISSMGAGCKSDPTRVMITDISVSSDDRLSRATRRRLKLLGVTAGIPVVFSTEKPGPGKATLLPLAEEEFAKGQVDEAQVPPMQIEIDKEEAGKRGGEEHHLQPQRHRDVLTDVAQGCT